VAQGPKSNKEKVQPQPPQVSELQLHHYWRLHDMQLQIGIKMQEAIKEMQNTCGEQSLVISPEGDPSCLPSKDKTVPEGED
jgi:hypothetical protein